MKFTLEHKDKNSGARLGSMMTSHGLVETPVFMPVATQGTVKALSSQELTDAGVEMLISNTYHLYMRPGGDIIRKAGGLHKFMAWNGAITTDSGGFQVFSLADLCKIEEKGVEFQSHIDGSRHFFTPESVVDFQLALGSDIIMPLDECVHYPAARDYVESSVGLTLKWARRSKDRFDTFDGAKTRPLGRDQERRSVSTLSMPQPLDWASRRVDTQNSGSALFGIVQGGTYRDQRERCAVELAAMDMDGYALGGMGVGEPEEVTNEITGYTASLLPEDKVRYLMGVGPPIAILEAISLGIDMFDCVVPTRNGRNGQAFTFSGEIQLRNATFKEDMRPIEEGCDCPVCRNYTRGYIRHLINAGEVLALRLVSLHNIYFYVKLIRISRQAILEDRFDLFKRQFIDRYQS